MPSLNPLQKKCLALAITQALASNTHAATITVNSNTDDWAGCTLREAIVSANTSVNQNNGCGLGSNSGTDTIIFSNSLASNSITLTGGQLVVGPGKNLNINAGSISQGVTVNANKASRVLSTHSPLILRKLTLTGGLATTATGGATDGGAIAAYSATLTLRDTTLSDNTAARRGGGIYADSSTLNLYNSSVSNNLTTGGEDSGARGGGIASENAGSITVSNSTVSGNTAFRVGGISARDVNLTLSNSVMTANTATKTNDADGGAIFSKGQVSLTINDSTLSGNSSPDGGAIAVVSGPTASMNNSTISGNSASRGGGIWVGGYSDSGLSSTTMTINNSTISGNTSSSDGGGIVIYGAKVSLNHTTLAANFSDKDGAAIDWSDGRLDIGALILKNSIIADSTGNHCDDSFNSISIDIDSATIIEDGSCSALRSGDPGLLPLADNGGPTLTHALGTDSIARNSATSTCLNTDQRGQLRDISDGACDVGAFEFIDGLSNNTSIFFTVPLKNGKAVIFNL